MQVTAKDGLLVSRTFWEISTVFPIKDIFPPPCPLTDRTANHPQIGILRF